MCSLAVALSKQSLPLERQRQPTCLDGRTGDVIWLYEGDEDACGIPAEENTSAADREMRSVTVLRAGYEGSRAPPARSSGNFGIGSHEGGGRHSHPWHAGIVHKSGYGMLPPIGEAESGGLV